MNVVEKVLRGVDGWQQRHKPAAFVFGVAKKYGDDNAGQLAGSLTYTGFVTLFPLLLVLTTVLGLVAAADPGLRHSVSDAVAGQFPLIGKQLTGNVGALRRSSLIGLIVGLAIVIWGTAGLAQNAMFAMAQVWNIPGPSRPGYVQRLGRSGLFLAGLLVGVVATTGLASLNAFSHHVPVLLAAADAVAMLVNVGMYLFAFRLLTPKGVPARALLPGAGVARRALDRSPGRGRSGGHALPDQPVRVPHFRDRAGPACLDLPAGPDHALFSRDQRRPHPPPVSEVHPATAAHRSGPVRACPPAAAESAPPRTAGRGRLHRPPGRRARARPDPSKPRGSLASEIRYVKIGRKFLFRKFGGGFDVVSRGRSYPGRAEIGVESGDAEAAEYGLHEHGRRELARRAAVAAGRVLPPADCRPVRAASRSW